MQASFPLHALSFPHARCTAIASIDSCCTDFTGTDLMSVTHEMCSCDIRAPRRDGAHSRARARGARRARGAGGVR